MVKDPSVEKEESMEVDEVSTPRKMKKNSSCLKQKLIIEDGFIKDILSLIRIPKHKSQYDSDSDVEDVSAEEKRKLYQGINRIHDVKELQERLQTKLNELKGPNADKKSKKKPLTKLEKKQKLREEKKLQMKKGKPIETSLLEKSKSSNTKPKKPVYNSEGKIVFSKFDFTEENGINKEKQKIDPKSALKKIQIQKEKMKSLAEIGKTERVKNMEEKTQWKTALEKAEGVKVKDDPVLLKKSIKRLEQRKKSSKKKWEHRTEIEDKRKESKQNKRTENIKKRKQEKKDKKMKKAAKKGRAIPGF